jgi:hypothetical protein
MKKPIKKREVIKNTMGEFSMRGHVAFELQTPLALKLFIETLESGQSASRHVPCTRSKAKLSTESKEWHTL